MKKYFHLDKKHITFSKKKKKETKKLLKDTTIKKIKDGER